MANNVTDLIKLAPKNPWGGLGYNTELVHGFAVICPLPKSNNLYNGGSESYAGPQSNIYSLWSDRQMLVRLWRNVWYSDNDFKVESPNIV